MTFKKTEETKIRYENYGCLYVLNRRNQNKAKISNKDEAFLFWLVSNGKHHLWCDKVKEWLKKGFIEEVKNQSEYEKFKKEFQDKPKGYCSAPLLATIEITSICNYRCRHCGNNSGEERLNELTIKETKNLIDQMEKLKVLKLTITGGEPLLKNGIFKILKYASRKVSRVSVTSNGSLIDRETSGKIKKAGVAAVKISLDGTEYFHDKHRGIKGAYKRVIAAIKNLADEGVEVRVQSTLMKDNGEEIIKLMPILENLKVEVHSIVPVAPIGRASNDLMIRSIDYKKFILKVNKIAKRMTGNTIFEIRPVFGLNGKNNLEVLSTKYKCEALKTTFEITSDGKIIPCSFLPIEIGNARKNSLLEIWESKKANQARVLFDEEKLKGKCVFCQLKSECGGGCIANSFALLNKGPYPDSYCWR